ncbi:M48 family metallopeptidase [Bradyrhizobium sp. 146]|uniref:M48 family metallopeptidase n=1 Tax=Bradyrhizobium sp. 146 TaxID=2782622 RepID=UPI001FF7B5A7|nr:SprT family zinc-dependent metalloprotease [Bradyrhizobium sp. 146]MCK1702603.1 M48 family metallopeptidase [Bradyrhizobium sp. 146]
MITELNIGDVSVDVVFKDIKNVHLSVHPPTGRVRIAAPARMKIEAVRVFAISKLGWIKKQQSKLQAQERESPREYLERESHYLWGNRYLLRVIEGERPSGAISSHRTLVLTVPQGAAADKRRQVLEAWYRAEMKATLEALVAKWEKRLAVRVERAFVQKMKTKWGSSSPRLHYIRLNLELAKKPPACLDYVVLHEMLHFIVPNHSERFVALLDHHLPQWRAVRQALNEAPLAHTDWTH